MSPQQAGDDAGAEQEDSSASASGRASRRRRAKGPSDNGGKDPAKGIADMSNTETVDDAQQTLNEVLSEVEDDDEANASGDDAAEDESRTAAAGGGGVVAPEAATSEAGELPEDADVDVDVEIVDDPSKLDADRDMVKIELADGEVVNGRIVAVHDDSVEVHKNFELWDEDNTDIQEFDMGELTDEDVLVRRYDTADMTDLPGVEPLSPEEGGYNSIPDGVTDADELLEHLREGDVWAEAAGINDSESFPISDDRADQMKQKQERVLSRLRDDDMKRAYARRTIIGNDYDNPANAPIYTPNGRPMNFMLAGKTTVAGDTAHEFGHGIAQMRGFVTPGDDISANTGDYWNTTVDPRNPEEIKPYMHSRSGVQAGEQEGTQEEFAYGWEDWSDDSKARIEGTTNEFESVDGSVGRDLTPGDVVRFADQPFDAYQAREWEVVEAADFDESIPEMTLRNRNGATKNVAAISERRGDDPVGVLETHAPPEAVAQGYSEISGKTDSDDYPETQFTQTGQETPTVDELREQYSTETWEETVDNFASQANRAYYEMRLRHAVRGQRIGIKDDYSAKNSHEVMSQMSETFQAASHSVAEQSKKVAQHYPEVTAAYLEMSEPSPLVKRKLAEVPGVTVEQ